MITFVVLHQYSPAESSLWDSWTSVGILKAAGSQFRTVIPLCLLQLWTAWITTGKKNMLCWCGGGEVGIFKVLHQYSMAGSAHGIPGPWLAHLGC